MRRLARAVARWHHAQHVKDFEHTIAHMERQVIALPREIRRMHEMRKFHQGRLDTLSSDRDVVNWRLGRGKGKA